jgi:hypothetical protein
VVLIHGMPSSLAREPWFNLLWQENEGKWKVLQVKGKGRWMSW